MVCFRPCVFPAVLAAGAPEEAAFMADEAVESVPGLGPIQYAAKHYALYLTKVTERTKALNKGEVLVGTLGERVRVTSLFWNGSHVMMTFLFLALLCVCVEVLRD